MEWINKINDVYLIDSRMFGFEHYSSIFLLRGEKLALIDTGLPSQLESVREGIKAHGFSVSDISHIFITHAHLDHYGNAGSLIIENPKATVYVHPEGLERLTRPDVALARSLASMPPQLAETFKKRAGEAIPVPRNSIQLLKDGEIFDLGNNKKLEVIFAPGHQPSGTVLLEKSSGGLFINDLVGNYFEDADVQITLSPAGADVRQLIKTLEKIKKLSPTVLFLGHFGICKKPQEAIQRAIDDGQRLLDIGTKCIREGKPEEIASKVLGHILPKLEKIKATRGEAQYNYLKEDLAPNLAINFARYMQAQAR